MGAVIMGWMIVIFYQLRGNFQRGEKEAWNTITLSLVVWYVFDSAFSWYMGFTENVILNTVFFALFIIPLMASRKYFRS